MIQDDLLEIYNTLLAFNETTIVSDNPPPIKVSFDKESNSIVFSQKGISVRIALPIYYSLGFNEIKKPTYLLPRDYDYLMQSLSGVIGSGKLLEDKLCVSPENYGFDIYLIDYREFGKGPDKIATIRFVSGNSWVFRLIVKFKYKV